MQLPPTITPSKVTARNIRVAEALNHAISVITSANLEYWQRPDDELLAEMNANPAATLATFEANYALAVALNSSQESLNVVDEQGKPVYSARAPIARGRNDIGFADGAFFIPPPAPEPAPEEQSLPVDP